MKEARQARNDKIDRVWSIGLLMGMLFLGFMPQARAFDPHTWATESTGAASTKFCITNDILQWNDEAKARVRDAQQRWQNAVPNFDLTLDTTTPDCQNGDPRIEFEWVDCWSFSNATLGITFWHPANPFEWDGTIRIAFFRYASCSTGAPLRKFNFNPGPGNPLENDQFDFQSLVEHEMGHGFGLHHPEGAAIVSGTPGAPAYPLKSYDGERPVMSPTLPVGSYGRVPRQDDVSGGSWARDRTVLARPNQIDFWGTFQGNLLTDSGNLVLTKDDGLPASDDYSYMFMTTRLSTDSRPSRETPTLHVEWRKTNGQSGGSGDRVRLRIRWNPVAPFSSGPPYEGNSSYDWGASCLDEHPGDAWETCQTTFSIGDFNVQDIRVYIYNSTSGRIQIQSISLQDGTT